jgi:hypothetical protein
MNATRLFLVAVVCFGFAGPTVYAQTDEEVAAEVARAKGPAKPWKQVRGFGRVLDLRNPPVIIDEPGLYAIDRTWRISAQGVPAIQVVADDVTLDLHGFEISLVDSTFSTLLMITGGAVEVRNGGLVACCDDGTRTVESTGIGTRLHHLSIYAYETMTFEGNSASITDSDLTARVEIALAGNSNLERNTISCNRGRFCLRLLEDGNRVTDNKWALYQGGGIAILGNRNLVVNNIVEAFEAPDALEAFVVEGDTNVVRANTVLGGFSATSIFVVGGTANTLDGNVLAPQTPTARMRTGMTFTADGNYYGGNRMAAQVPFDLGGTVQTDWGGNVGY